MRTPARYLVNALVLLVLASGAAQAERIVFQRGDALFVADRSGSGVRRLFAIGPPGETVWAPSTDGRRVAWFVPIKSSASGVSLQDRPVAVWVADLSGQRKKRLFTTGDLRDLQKRRVTQLSINGEAGNFKDWALDSLSWSADGRSLYLSCTLLAEGGGRATFVADSVLGAAVVDASGRWKSIAAMTQVDARGPVLVGVGLDHIPGATRQARAGGKFYPLMVTNLAEGKTVALLAPTFRAAERPPYALASGPVLSPDARSIVFAALGNGLWQVDVGGKNYLQLTSDPADDAPCWSADGQQVLFLSTNPAARDAVTAVYEIPLVSPASGVAVRRLVLTGVERFFVLPD